MRRIILAIVGLGAARWALGYLVLDLTPIPASSRYTFDLERTRELAGAVPGPLPIQINYEVVGSRAKPKLLATGALSFESYRMVWTVFQIVYANDTILIDLPPLANARDETAATVRAAARGARMILFTHEHPDHLGGLVGLVGQIGGRVHLTRPQREQHAELWRAGLSPADLEQLAPLDVPLNHPLAAGVVVLAAPGHTPGSQLVYVRLQRGDEVVLAGDVGWHGDHVEGPSGRPRISAWWLGEDVDAVGHQLRRLHELARDHGVHVVLSHDGERLAAQAAAGVVVRGFAPKTLPRRSIPLEGEAPSEPSLTPPRR